MREGDTRGRAMDAIRVHAATTGDTDADALVELFGIEALEGAIANKRQDEAFRGAAMEKWNREEINVDEDAVVSRGDDKDGAFVAAWVWVSAAELKKWKDENAKGEGL